MSRSRSLALIVAAALTAALAPAALASAAAPAKEDKAKAEHDRIVEYWTPERMKAAKPRDFVRQKDGSFALAPTPKARPAGGTTSTVISSTSGASWTKGGDVLKRTGKVYFSLGTLNYQCSGSVASDGSRRRQLACTDGRPLRLRQSRPTAGLGHQLGLHSRIRHQPGYDNRWLYCARQTRPTGAGQPIGWSRTPDSRRSATYTTRATQARLRLRGGGSWGQADRVLWTRAVGAYDLALTVVAASQRLSAFGYPAAGKYNGRTSPTALGP